MEDLARDLDAMEAMGSGLPSPVRASIGIPSQGPRKGIDCHQTEADRMDGSDGVGAPELS